MFRRIDDVTISLEEWIDLNTSEVPTELIEELYGYGADQLHGRGADHEEERELHRLDNVCPTCEGSCSVEDGEGDFGDCETCKGSGTDPAVGELYGFPFAHGTCWVLDRQQAVVTALIESGFVVYRCEGGPFDRRLVFGIDGGGYSFSGQHWIPLRLRLAFWRAAQYGAPNDGVYWPEYRALASKLLEDAKREGESARIERVISELAGQ